MLGTGVLERLQLVGQVEHRPELLRRPVPDPQQAPAPELMGFHRRIVTVPLGVQAFAQRVGERVELERLAHHLVCQAVGAHALTLVPQLA